MRTTLGLEDDLGQSVSLKSVRMEGKLEGLLLTMQVSQRYRNDKLVPPQKTNFACSNSNPKTACNAAVRWSSFSSKLAVTPPISASATNASINSTRASASFLIRAHIQETSR